jgi:acetylornithine deacetylase/succinyl-diaminopimelate desuccinylase-like protein
VDAKTGKVKIPGFYEDVVDADKGRDQEFPAVWISSESSSRQAYGFKTLRTQDPAEVMRRIWAAPTFEVHGLVGGYHGPGVKTVVPGHGELKVSMRLVPNQTPEKAFALLKKHVAKLNPDVKVEREGMLHPFQRRV